MPDTTQSIDSFELPVRQHDGYHLAAHAVLGQPNPHVLVLALPGTEGERMREDDPRPAGIAVVRAEGGTNDGEFGDLEAAAGTLPGDPEAIAEAIALYVRESLTAEQAALLDPSSAGTVVRFVH